MFKIRKQKWYLFRITCQKPARNICKVFVQLLVHRTVVLLRICALVHTTHQLLKQPWFADSVCEQSGQSSEQTTKPGPYQSNGFAYRTLLAIQRIVLLQHYVSACMATAHRSYYMSLLDLKKLFRC